MTRTVPAPLQTTLSGSSMALAVLVKLERPDGVIIPMTTWDKPLAVNLDGAGLMTYAPRDIAGVTAFSASINAAIDDAELSVAIDDNFISDDARRQFFNGTQVKIGYVDPDDLANPWLHRQYEIGEVHTEGVRIRFELLGREKRLEQNVGVPLTVNCRYQFGSVECGLNLNVPVWQPNAAYEFQDEVQPSDGGQLWYYASSAGTGTGTSGPTEPAWSDSPTLDNDIVWTAFAARRVAGIVTAVTDARNFAADGIDMAPDWFGDGMIEWTYGLNTGEKQRIRSDSGTGSIIQHRPCLDVPAIGDTFYAVAGCRKRLTEDCVLKHHNAERSSSRTLRFGGFPFLAPESSGVNAPKENNNKDNQKDD